MVVIAVSLLGMAYCTYLLVRARIYYRESIRVLNLVRERRFREISRGELLDDHGWFDRLDAISQSWTVMLGARPVRHYYAALERELLSDVRRLH